MEDTECQNVIQLELRGNDKSEVVDATQEFDDILEKISKKLNGFVEKRFLFSKDLTDRLGYVNSQSQEYKMDPLELPQNRETETEMAVQSQQDQQSQAERDLREMMRRLGKITAFQKFVLKKRTESRVFLDGALKITRTKSDSPFSFFGRFASHSVFDRVADFLKSDNSMV